VQEIPIIGNNAKHPFLRATLSPPHCGARGLTREWLLRPFLSKNIPARLPFHSPSLLRQPLHKAAMRRLPRLDGKRKFGALWYIFLRQWPKLARQAARSAVLCRVLGPESSLLKIMRCFRCFRAAVLVQHPLSNQGRCNAYRIDFNGNSVVDRSAGAALVPSPLTSAAGVRQTCRPCGRPVPG
jgi:hypothetical protein